MIMNGKTPTLISGVPKRAPSRGDDQVAGQREPERAGEHVAVGGAQRRLAELADQPEQAREALGPEVLVDERHVGGEARRGCRRAENTFSCVEVSTTQRTASSSRAALERGEQLVEQLVGQRVARLGLVERDRRDAASATS